MNKPFEKSPQYRPKTNLARLGYLIEECGEVLAAAGKSLRWGYASANPKLPVEQRETNGAWLSRELYDLESAIRLIREDLLDYPPDPRDARETLFDSRKGGAA